ncbi:MAG TPA: ABC transporter substrate-binding protein [Casimicrobiaceae bacterium]|nr:ABC transporter substrate-binding protein [Casimicrobiaceae bacterium]
MRFNATRVTVFLLACMSLAFGRMAQAADPNKVLRVATYDIETLDPQQYNDDPSFQIIMAIFEPLYEWDYLGASPRLSPVTAAGPVEVTDGGKTWIMRVKPGIFFTDDPAFKGKPRELVAADYVYSYKRWIDPNLHRGGQTILTDLIVGARAVVDAARSSGKFDYDRPIAGMLVLDRYTLQLTLTEPNYPNINDLIGFVGAAAREVVEAAGGDIRDRPVGTGPYRLKEWKRGSRVILEANPKYRSLKFPESNASADAALEKRMRGKTLPQVGVIEVNVIEEDLTRMLEFESGALDYALLRGEIANRMLLNGKLKPEYTAKGMTRFVVTEPFLFSLYFNMTDPVIGGMSNDRVALRRAMAMGFDRETEVEVVFAGQALVANQIVPPGVSGHDPNLSAKRTYDPSAANALLDRFGYRDRDSAGYRMTPDGKPLTVTISLRSGGITRELSTLLKKNMDAIGIRMDFHITPFQDVIKELEQGKFQMYAGGYGGNPSGWSELTQLYSRQPRTVNITAFKLSEYDRAFEQFLASPGEAGQIKTARVMSEIARTYMPMLPNVFRLESQVVQPWVDGFSPFVFQQYWKYLDIDLARRPPNGR